MDLSFSSNNQTNNIIQKDVDPNKYATIVEKLCVKRKTLEDSLANTSLQNEIREETALDLMRLKESMNTFGVNEIVYQSYLEKERKKDQTLPMF